MLLAIILKRKRCKYMLSQSDTLRTIAELAAVVFAIYAMVNEKKFIKFEDRIIRKIKEVISKW